MRRSKVDLPEPFGPVTARSSPEATAKDFWANTARPPRTAVSPVAVSRISLLSWLPDCSAILEALDRQTLIIWRRQSRFTIKPATRAVACRNASGDWAIGKDRPAKKTGASPAMPAARSPGPPACPPRSAGASNRHFGEGSTSRDQPVARQFQGPPHARRQRRKLRVFQPARGREERPQEHFAAAGLAQGAPKIGRAH